MKHKFFWAVLAVILVFAGVLFLQGEEFSRVGEKSGDRQAYLDRDTESTETLGTEESTQEAERGQTDSGYYGPLQVNGTKLTDADGNLVQLRGVSTHGLAWYPEYVNEQAVAYMHQKWGINVIRLALYTTGSGGYCVSEDGSRQYMEDMIDIGVKAAAENDMYVIIDWHILEDGNPNTYIGRAKDFFAKISEKYKDYENVLYEICNEPNGGTQWSDVKNYAETIIPVIRENDSDAVIIVGTPTWCQDVDQAAADPITDQDNIMYALHFYAGTHKEELRNRADQAMEAGLPIFVSEFGLCDASGNGANDLDEADRWMDWMNNHQISCVQWNLSNKDETCALIDSSCTKTTDWKDEDLSESGVWMKEHIGGIVGRQTPDQDAKHTDSQESQETTEPSDSEESDADGTGSENSDAKVEQVNNWDNGSASCTQYGVVLTNPKEKTSTSWTLTIRFDQKVSLQNSWCGKYAISDDTITITPEDYNNAVVSGKSIDNVGFIVESAAIPKVVETTVTWE